MCRTRFVLSVRLWGLPSEMGCGGAQGGIKLNQTAGQNKKRKGSRIPD